MSESPPEPTRAFTETEARKILLRASELDASHADRVTAADLHRMATEALIAPSALEEALREALGEGSGGAALAPAEEDAARRGEEKGKGKGSFWRKLALGTGFLGVGTALGAFAVAVDNAVWAPGPGHILAFLGPCAAFVLYRALRHRWSGSVAGFLGEMGLTLGAFTLSLQVLAGQWMMEPLLLWSGACALVGSAIVSVGLHFRNPEPRAQPEGGS